MKNASNDISFEGIVQYKSYDSSNDRRPVSECWPAWSLDRFVYGCRSLSCPPSAAAAQAMNAPMIIASAVKIEAAALALRAASAA